MGVARSLLDALTDAAPKRPRRTLRDLPSPLRVNLGSGINVAPGWVNIDVNFSTLVAPLPAPLVRLAWRASSGRRWVDVDEYVRRLKHERFVHHDLTRGIPIEDEIVDAVYSSHFFEHLTRNQALALFAETRRILKPGGVFRINVPNSVDQAADAFEAGRWEEGLDLLFSENGDGKLDQHRYAYNFDVLRNMLTHAGFSEVTRRERAVGTLPDLEFFEQRPTGLYAEATV